ncbi:uncharacterized protein [Anoplolepis gracilipes]|uniref:uncharacterized protein n=1 Tax=Anoplolepis gracilipes TaxID=354296 RepID=UPI003B9EDD25
MRISHIQNRIEQQLALSSLIFQAIESFNRIAPAEITTRLVNARIAALKDNWEKFTIIHDAIIIAISHLSTEDKQEIKKHAYFGDEHYLKTYERYLESVDKISIYLDSEEVTIPRTTSTQSLSQPASQQLSVSHHTRLPRIDLPKFNGTASEWISFKDLFSSIIIENTTLSSVEKLQYLKASLTGTAAHLLKNTAITAGNFQKAWNDLVSFYENKRLLVNSAIQALLSLKRIPKESASDLEVLYTSIMQIYRTLETLQRPVDKWDDFLVFLAIQRLDSESVKVWEQHLGSTKEPPTWKHFCEFLVTRLLSLQAFEKSQNISTKKKTPHYMMKSYHQMQKRSNTNQSAPSCIICDAKHFLTGCPQYNSQTTQQWYFLVTKHGLCYNCLGKHRISECRSLKRCMKCGKKHHTTIHKRFPSSKENNSENTNPNTSIETIRQPGPSHALHASIHPAQLSTTSMLLATAQVLIINETGRIMKIRALIDQGSEVTLISERIVQALKLPRSQSFIPLVGVGEQSPNRTRGVTSFKLKSLHNNLESFKVSAHILTKLTSLIPSNQIAVKPWAHLKELPLADPQFGSPSAIELIIGADFYHQIIKEGLRKGPPDTPIAQLTSFGWILSGPASTESTQLSAQSYHITMDSHLYDLLHRFWQLEEVSAKPEPAITPEDLQCERHFKDTHSRDAQGRYVVRLPFKNSPQLLGDSYNKATKMMSSLQNKLKTNTKYAEAYVQFMKEYEDLQHIKPITNVKTEHLHPNFYLPHHGVWREHSSTTKLRVVFNGSSRTTSGVSLNDILHSGPKLQVDLFNVLIWFRQFRYDFLLIWKKCTGKSMFTLMIGDSSVSAGQHLKTLYALRTISQLIEDDGQEYPLAVPCLRQGRYVDDIFGGAETVEKVLEIIHQLNRLCMAGGFPLQKWASNDANILNNLPANQGINPHPISMDQDAGVAILGLHWKPASDCFYFLLDRLSTTIITKRTILSTIAKFFDPLGLLSPVIIKAKVLIQNLWVNKLEWDEPLPAPIANKWIAFVEELEGLNEITIPRWIEIKPGYQIQIHGFCHASTQALAALVYIRTVNPEGNITTSLITTKTKKFLSTSGKENPADDATRGLSPSQLSKQVTWWKGPSWLSQSSDIWPNHSFRLSASDNLEARPPKIYVATKINNQPQWDLMTRYSNLTKLLRITALCIKAVERFKHSQIKTFGPLTTVEIDAAKAYWVKTIQNTHFAYKFKLLSQGLSLPKSNPLNNLTPFLDSTGLIRTGGRLRNSQLPPESKHLLILPKQSTFTQLIIADAHTRTCHGGTQITLTFIRNYYWIVGGRLPVKSHILRCVICIRYRQKRAQQLMGQLPSERVTPTTRPFLHTGVDYAGPLLIKTWKGKNARQYKAYIVVFVCYSTSAVHLELVTDYSADAFIAAYKRFTARRGICVTLSSDCGINLIGADAELKRLFSTASQEQERLASLLSNDGTQWRFNPPSAPHFGGKWEAAVKSVKFHLKRIVGSHLLTYEEMTTLLTQIEAVLNSRPLCPLSDDPDDLTVLTPGHFLIGTAPTVLPEPSLEHVNCSRLSRWQLLRQMLESFWSRWSKECLQRFHDTSKWTNPTLSLEQWF